MSEQATSPTIAKDMLIGETVERYPDVADVFLSYGLHCVGCHVNAFETIEQGALGHGMVPEEVDEMIEEANSYLAQLATTHDGVLVTARAADMLRTLAAEEGKSGWGLRMDVTGECCTPHYELEFEEKPREGDTVLTEGYTIHIGPESYAQLRGARLDYIEGANGAGFKIDNPNAKKSCACGGH